MNRIPNSIIFANGKGGVGKSTTCVNLAFEAARRGAPVTILDFDPQATAIESLGIDDHDQGKSLLATCLGVSDLTFYPTTAPNVRIIASGEHLRKLANVSILENADPHHLANQITNAITPHLRPGEWVFVDCEPALGTHLTDAALLFGEHLVTVTGFDKFEKKGVQKVLKRVIDLDRSDRSMINMLGILFNNIPINSAKAKLAKEAAWFDERLDGLMPVFNTFIRQADKATRDSRESGLTAAQLADFAETAELPKWYEVIGTDQTAISFAKNTPDLADDYRRLADEMLQRQALTTTPVIDLTKENERV